MNDQNSRKILFKLKLQDTFKIDKAKRCLIKEETSLRSILKKNFEFKFVYPN